MAISIFPVSADFAAEVGDVDLARPLAADDLAAIKSAFWKYAVLVFPDQRLTVDQHLAFARQFGPLESASQVGRPDGENAPPRRGYVDPSNLDENNEIVGADTRLRMVQLANRLWHTDSSFRHVPAQASLLYARTVAPIGGHTEFADMRGAWDALPPATQQRIDDLIVEHWFITSRAKVGFTDFTDEERAEHPPVLQLLVRTIPETGRRSLFLASHAGRVMGLTGDASQRLIDELTAHAVQRQFVYTHRWRVHDLVVWDNRCTMHRGTDFDDLRWKRDIKRATVSDAGNTLELAGIDPLAIRARAGTPAAAASARP